MKKYTISQGEKELATGIEAESAIAALDSYCSAHPDDDTGFQRGGLNCDAETRGEKSASVRTDAGRMRWHRLQLRIPILGDLIRKQAIARMTMVIAALLKSDVVFARAVQIAQRTVNNRVLRSALEACEQAVLAGQDISLALEETRAFPPLVIQVFAVGQASGRLDAMLDNLAADYDTQVEITSHRLTTLLEPVMMILLAILVGFIAFATILPILEAGDVL